MRRNDNHPPAFLAFNPRALADVMFICEHASRALPFAPPKDVVLRRTLHSHWGWDIGAWKLTRALAHHFSAAAVGGRWSRLWVDLNREADDPTLMRASAGGVPIPWNLRLTAFAAERRWMEVHVPFHAEVDRVIFRHRYRGGSPWLIAVHTFTPELDGERRPFDIGVLFSDYRKLAHRVGKAMREEGLRVRYNEPYSGLEGMMYTVHRHGSHHRLPCLELEFNQALFEDPQRFPALRVAALRAIENGLAGL